MEFRPASEADLEGEYVAFEAAMTELRTRRGGAWSASPFNPDGTWAAVHRHLLANDGSRSYVAEDGDRIAGFTAAWLRDDCWFLSALFVDPAYQGRGVCRGLLDHIWDGSHARRITITEAIQPVSTGLYARRGLLPVTPILEFSGTAHADAVDRLVPAPPTPDALRILDAHGYGFDRAVDHAFWARTSTHATVWLREREPVAYSYRSGSKLGPIAGRDAECAGQALRAELARSGGDEVTVAIPGTATRLVQVALAAGLRLTDPGLLLLSPSAMPAPTALAIHSYWLL